MIAGIGYNRLLADNKKLRELLLEWITINSPEEYMIMLHETKNIIENTKYVEEQS